MTERLGPKSKRASAPKGAPTGAHELDLPRHLQASSRARRALTGWYGDVCGFSSTPRAKSRTLCAGVLEERELADANIVLSELVNNALIHGRGLIRMATHLDADRLRIEVTDEGSGFQRDEHIPRDLPLEQLRGLAVIEMFSNQWGIPQGSTLAWAEIERSDATP